MEASPAQHLLIVIREKIGDWLLCEGHSEESILYADRLASAYWTGRTIDVILSDLRFILDAGDCACILGWCKCHYPILYSTIPNELRDVDAAVYGPFHPAYNSQESN